MKAKTENEIRSAFKKYADGYIESSCIYNDSILTQAYNPGFAPVSPDGYFLDCMGVYEDLLLQAAEIKNLNELPEPEDGYLEYSSIEYWQNQLAGAFYKAACELADNMWGVGGWHEVTVPEIGGWDHIVLYKNYEDK